MDRVAIITGSSRGIGAAIASELAGGGCKVVLCARDASALAAAAERIGPLASIIALDLREPGAPARLTDFAIERHGRIDVLVNNAGATRRGDFADLTDADWEDGFALKFFGAVRLTRAAWPYLAASGGSLLNIGGTGGRTPGAEFAIGGSVNAALLSFTKAMAEVGIRDGVQVNLINPGTVRTGRFAKRLEGIGGDPADAERRFVESAGVTRVGEPADIAALAAFIVSPAGRFLHSSLIDMDGGATKTI